VAEATEVMVRPSLAEPVEPLPTAAQDAVETQRSMRRRGLGTWTWPAAAVLLVGVAVWMMVPVGGAPAQSGVVDSAPAVQTPVVTPAVDSTLPLPVSSPRAVQQPAATVIAPTRTRPDVAPASDPVPPALFKNVKWLSVSGTSTSTKDATLTLSSSEISAVPAGGTQPLTTMPYGQISKATYVHARDPLWQPGFAAPAGKIDVPGIMGRSRHWLVLQTGETYAILRLDGDDRVDMLKTFEARAGVTIDRPSKK